MKGRLASTALLGALMIMLSGCLAQPPVGIPGDPAPIPTPSPGPPDPGGPTTPSPPSPTPGVGQGEGDPGVGQGEDEGDGQGDNGGDGTDAAIAAFQQRCAEGVEEWRAGLVDYPDRMSVTIEIGANYNAAVDVRSEPLPPDEVIEVEDGVATGEPVLVKCTIAARLTPVGDALDVAEQASETDAGWVLQEFTPSGVVEWSWTVTAHDPVDEQLRLELRPAIVVDESAGDLEYAGRSVSSFTTDVHVEASFLHHAAHWVDVNRPLIWTIASAVGAATLALIVWWRKVRSPRKHNAAPAGTQLRPE